MDNHLHHHLHQENSISFDENQENILQPSHYNDSSCSSPSVSESENCFQPNQPRKHRRKRKAGEVPVPHKLIEKRRRDRINKNLDVLRTIVPEARQSTGVKNDKAVLLQIVIQHIQNLRSKLGIDEEEDDKENASPSLPLDKENDRSIPSSAAGIPKSRSAKKMKMSTPDPALVEETVMNGYQECTQEALRFLIEDEGLPASNPLVARLQRHLNSNQRKLNVASLIEDENKKAENFNKSATGQDKMPKSRPISPVARSPPTTGASPRTHPGHRAFLPLQSINPSPISNILSPHTPPVLAAAMVHRRRMLDGASGLIHSPMSLPPVSSTPTFSTSHGPSTPVHRSGYSSLMYSPFEHLSPFLPHTGGLPNTTPYALTIHPYLSPYSLAPNSQILKQLGL